MQDRHKKTRIPNHKLRQQRESRGWSQREVALKLQALFPGVAVTANDIRRWEIGERKPGPYYRPKLCALFGVTEEELGFPSLSVSSDHNVEEGETDEKEERRNACPEVPTPPTNTEKTEEGRGENVLLAISLHISEIHDPTQKSEVQSGITSAVILGSPYVLDRSTQIGVSSPSSDTKFEDIMKTRQESQQGEKGEESVNRREANKVLSTFGLQLFSSNSTRGDFLSSPFSLASLHNLTVITQQFREMHRRGDTFFWPGLHAHITTIQDLLTSTTEDTIRRELWRLFAQTQLLVRLGYQPNPAKRQELAQGKTYNELAIAYAQLSGDTALKGGTIGHLAQFYLRQEPDLAKATQYLSEARPFARGNNALTGWLSLLHASIDAKTGQARQCEKDLAYAIEIAHALPQSPEYSDVCYTDFSLVSAQAFCINCWLTIGNPRKAQACFTEMNLADLSENRQAGTLYDVSELYAALGDFSLTQTYALQAIDKAIKTHQLYVISRCRKLATTILEKERHEPHATAILEYAQIIQEHYKGSTDLC
jgi:transcriptional regulator with XRE-family HTH domain/tetratricopeptide (TPR) repeat protein